MRNIIIALALLMASCTQQSNSNVEKVVCDARMTKGTFYPNDIKQFFIEGDYINSEQGTWDNERFTWKSNESTRHITYDGVAVIEFDPNTQATSVWYTTANPQLMK